MHFHELPLSKETVAALEKHKIIDATEIQEAVIPSILEGKDILAQSETGSGKTLAFGLPIIEKVSPLRKVQAIILTPTRELAQQVAIEFEKFSAHKRLGILTIYGGVSLQAQVKLLPQTDIVVGTPGRVLDLLERHALKLDNVSYFVLDEADRMLDMGFIDDVEKILHAARGKKQVLLFSATIPQQIVHLTKKYLHEPKRVTIQPQQKVLLLKQYYYDIPQNQKLSLLVHLLKKEQRKLVLIFCRTKRTTDFVAAQLYKNGIRAKALHGDLSQSRREAVVEEFKKGHVEVLVATDVAARGLHVDNISHVYNYELPTDTEMYVHRIGRTARMGKEGVAISLLGQMDHDAFQGIYRLYPGKIIKLEAETYPRIHVEMHQHDSQGGQQRFGMRPRTQQSGGHGGSQFGSGSRFGRRPAQSRSGTQRPRRY